MDDPQTEIERLKKELATLRGAVSRAIDRADKGFRRTSHECDGKRECQSIYDSLTAAMHPCSICGHPPHEYQSWQSYPPHTYSPK